MLILDRLSRLRLHARALGSPAAHMRPRSSAALASARRSGEGVGLALRALPLDLAGVDLPRRGRRGRHVDHVADGDWLTEALSKPRLNRVDAYALLLSAVAIADSDALVFECLAVDREAEGSPGLVHARVALAH